MPIGPLTTYRVGGRGGIVRPGRSRSPTWPFWRAPCGRRGCPVVMLGRGSNMLVADAGFAGIVVSATALTDGFEIDAEQRRRPRRGVGGASRARPPDGGPRSHRLRVGGRRSGFDRRCGADERRWPRIRHRGLARRGRRRRPRRARRPVVEVRAAADLGLRFRGSGLGRAARARGAVATGAGRPDRIRGDHQRGRGMASGQSARWSERRVGVRQPGAG